MKPTDIRDIEYFHKVIDCQFACPAYTPVPEYIRLVQEPVAICRLKRVAAGKS